MTLDEFSKQCEKAADAIHALMDEFDDDDDPQWLRQAILAQHLRYVLPTDIIEAISKGPSYG